MSERVPVHVRRLVSMAAMLVPGYRRANWRRQWNADLEHLCAAPGPRGSALLFALGSIRHALFLRFEDVRMRGLTSDARHAVRGVLRRPGFAALAVSTLAIGIGAATAIFSLAEAMILRPLPLPDEGRLVRVFSANPSRGMGSFSVSWPDYADLAKGSNLFGSSSLYMERDQDISGSGDPERVRTIWSHERFFQTLGSRFILGRGFGNDDHLSGATPSAVLSERFWVRRFGADSTIVGATVRLDGEPHTVVGVVADGEGWPRDADVWTPLRWGGVPPEWADRRSNHTWQVVGRLVEGVSVGDASSRVREMARAIYSADGVEEREAGTEAYVVPLRASAGGEGAGALFATLGTAVFFVLLISCMNASGLLLTRAWARARELSVRSALGAGRGRLVSVMLTESVLLALLGGAAGVVLGHWAISQGFQAAPAEIRAGSDVRLNGTVVAVAVGVSLIAAFLSGLVPALRATRTSLSEALKEGGAATGVGRSSMRLRQGLIVGEIALSLALLVGAGLTVRGFQRQIATDPGFEADRLVSFTVRLPGTRYQDESSVDDFYRRAVEQLERHPGVVSATSTSNLPLGASGTSLRRSFIFDGATPRPEGVEYGALWVEVDPRWFETLGLAVSEGRTISDEDDLGAPLVAVVNRRMARRMSPDASIVGRDIRSFRDENLPRTVIGVIEDVQFNGVNRANRQPVVLVPRAQAPRLEMAFIVRTVGDPSEMIPVVRQIMGGLEGDIALHELQSLRDAHAADLGGIRFLTTLFAAFGALALVLAVSGVYGLVAYSVSLRTREVGVRMAMGATRRVVRTSVLAESGRLAAIGLVCGLALAYVAGRVLAAGLDGVAIMELSTYVGVAALLVAAVLAASWVPATRATRVDPVHALRSD